MNKYEKILNKLAKEECIEEEYEYIEYSHEFSKDNGDIFSIDRKGTFCPGMNDYSAEQIKAIAKACVKIAALGKENQQ